ncbi:MAG: STN domain-containing protein, partial [Opitutaceae bacterium]
MIPIGATLRLVRLAALTLLRVMPAPLCLFVLAPIALAADTAPRTFDLPAGNAAETLKRFAEQAKREIMFPAEPVAGVKTNAVKGAFTPRHALDRMLANTALIVVEDARTGALMVNRAAHPEPPRPPPQSKSKNTRPQEPPKAMKTIKNPIAVVATWLALIFSPAQAQPDGTGTIEGRVLNASNG